MSVDMNNKENFRSDIFKASVHTSSNSNSNVSNGKSRTGDSSKKERRSFKCERLSNIFSRDNKEHRDKGTCDNNPPGSASRTRKINSAPVYRKNKSSTNFDDEDQKSTGKTSDLSEMTTFPFDREAIDYERIQRECFTFEEEYDDDDEDDDVYTATRKSIFQYDYDDTEDSPSYEMLDQKIAPIEGIFQQYALISQHEKERQNKKRAQSPITSTTTTTMTTSVAVGEKPTLSKIEHINRKLNETSALIHEQPANSNLTSPIPDLKIDFFAEPSSVMASSYSRENENVKSDALDECQLNVATSSFGSKNTMSNNNVNSNINGSINLTSNPMSTAVCTTPRATIVVQQVCFID